jgi:hypothetical protein
MLIAHSGAAHCAGLGSPGASRKRRVGELAMRPIRESPSREVLS